MGRVAGHAARHGGPPARSRRGDRRWAPAPTAIGRRSSEPRRGGRMQRDPDAGAPLPGAGRGSGHGHAHPAPRRPGGRGMTATSHIRYAVPSEVFASLRDGAAICVYDFPGGDMAAAKLAEANGDGDGDAAIIVRLTNDVVGGDPDRLSLVSLGPGGPTRRHPSCSGHAGQRGGSARGCRVRRQCLHDRIATARQNRPRHPVAGGGSLCPPTGRGVSGRAGMGVVSCPLQRRTARPATLRQ